METLEQKETKSILAMGQKIKAYEDFISSLAMAADLGNEVFVRKLVTNAQIAMHNSDINELLKVD